MQRLSSPSRTHGRRVLAILALAGLAMVSDGGPIAPERKPVRLERIAVLHPAGSLGAVVAGFGDLWIDDRTRQRLLRVDGRSGQVEAEIPIDGRVALSVGSGAVWALQAGDGYGLGLGGPVLRIDPRSNRVRARIPLATSSGRSRLGLGIQADAGGAWVWGPYEVMRIGRRAGSAAARIAVGAAHGQLTGLTATADEVVAGTADGHILRFDARTGTRTGDFHVPVPRPSPKAISHRLLLYTSPGVAAALDLTSGLDRWRRLLGFRTGATLAGDGLVWVHSSAVGEPGDRVTALRLATGGTVTTGIVPAFGSTGIAVSGGRVSIATAGGQLLSFSPFAA